MASEGAGMELVLRALVLEGGRGAGGCPGTLRKERLVRPWQGEEPRGRPPASGSQVPGLRAHRP